MKGYELEVINTLDNAEIDLLIKILHQEKDKRARLEQEKLVNAFLNAWSDLRENGIVITYEDEVIDACVDLYKRDCFYFD